MIIFTPNTVISSTDVNGNLDELKTKTDYLSAPDSDWISPTLLNSWVTYDTNFNTAGYRIDALGYVHLKGMIKNGTSTMFTLPAGYRPKNDGTRRLLMTGQASGGIGRVDILISGNIDYISGGTGWFSLDGMSFKAEA